MRALVVVLGDQLAEDLSALDDLDPGQDVVWMAEVEAEATRVRAHKRRLAAFFSAMRHHRDALERRGLTVRYHALGPDPARDRGPSLAAVLRRDLQALRPARVVLTEPGDHRVRTELVAEAERAGVPLEIRRDRHFFDDVERFSAWARGRKSLVLETYYRGMRRAHGVLVDARGRPAGGAWNLDRENREAFPREGPGRVPRPRAFRPDAVTREVIALVERRFADHPGRLEGFDLPVTAFQAREALEDFVEHRLALFGRYEDAMWSGEPFLYHSRLSFVLNVHLLDPREAIDAAVQAYRGGRAPLNSVEGFVRQILGWREFVRGVYWREMPGYAGRNALRCGDVDVPPSYWTGETGMACVATVMRQVLEHGYAHHIQRLMVLGLYAQLLGVHPYRFHEWHMAMYVDAVDWVSLPNTLGMSQYGDGGLVGTNPYCASGAYVNRMSDACRGCRFDPREATGERACPLTTLYWDFLARHRKAFAQNARMGFQLKNLERKPADELAAIRRHARVLRENPP